LRRVERILIFFGRNVTDKVSNRKTYYYATSNNMCFCTTWQSTKTRKSHFHSNAVFVHCLIQPAVWFLQSFWLTTHTHDAVWLPKSCDQCVRMDEQMVGGTVQEKGSRERCRSWTVFHAQCSSAPVRCLLGFPFRNVMQKH